MNRNNNKKLQAPFLSLSLFSASSATLFWSATEQSEKKPNETSATPALPQTSPPKKLTPKRKKENTSEDQNKQTTPPPHKEPNKNQKQTNPPPKPQKQKQKQTNKLKSLKS